MTAALKKDSNQNAAYELIMDAIITQKLRPRQKVSENILVELFDLSRTVSRNLMEQLTAKQFLISTSPRITQVAPLTLFEIKQNFALRKLLIPEAISLASQNINLDKVRAINKKLEKEKSVKNDALALKSLKENRKLNLMLCDSAHYPIMSEWTRQLEDTAMRIYWLFIKIKKAYPFSTAHHERLFSLIQEGDQDKIRTVSRENLDHTEELILNAIFSHEQLYTQDLKV